MSGTEQLSAPQFLEGEVLPIGYFDPPNPSADPPSCKMDLSGLLAYMVANGKKSGWDLTKEEMKKFES
ncbi:MAG: hypothetical protein IJI53_10605 [Clostridia bacterium]|nr:hypothetical protein [Clostridia bacterium]MBR3018888.1 hypothetical protein [Clostridia bacterium]